MEDKQIDLVKEYNSLWEEHNNMQKNYIQALKDKERYKQLWLDALKLIIETNGSN